jgi:hypothetical protein
MRRRGRGKRRERRGREEGVGRGGSVEVGTRRARKGDEGTRRSREEGGRKRMREEAYHVVHSEFWASRATPEDISEGPSLSTPTFVLGGWELI